MSRAEPVDLAYLRELSTRLLADGAPVDGMVVGAAAREIYELRGALADLNRQAVAEMKVMQADIRLYRRKCAAWRRIDRDRHTEADEKLVRRGRAW